MEMSGFSAQYAGKLAGLDLLVIVCYMALCLYIGFRKSGDIRNIKDFALGNSGISTFVLVCTIYATHLGAGATFGSIEKMRDMGMIFAISVLTLPIGWAFKIWVFASNIEKFRGCLSLSDIMHRLYGSVGQWSTNIMSIVLGVGAIAAQANILGYVIYYCLGIPLNYAVVLGVGVLVIYSTCGGIRAVAFTDALQFIIFFIAMPYLCAVGFNAVGGVTGIKSAIPLENLIPEIGLKEVPIIIGFMVYSMTYSSEGAFVQRFLMSGDSKQLSKALKTVVLLDLIMATTLCVLGLVIATLLPSTASSKTALLQAISDLLPMGIAGLVISGLLAIIMSTADSWLNVTSVLCAHDIVKRLFPSITDRQEVILARLSSILIGFIAATLAINGGGALELIWASASIYSPIIFLPMVSGFLGFRTNAASFIASMLIAASATLWGAYVQGGFDLVSLASGISGSAIGLFGMHYYQVKTGKLDRRLLPRDEDDVWEGRPTFTNRVRDGLHKLRWKHLVLALNRTVLQDPPRYYSFAGLGLVFNFIVVLMIVAFSCSGRASCTMEIVIRMLAVLGCAALCFHEQWLGSWKRWLPSYWYTLQIWCLPVLSVYSLLLHHDYMMWVPYAIFAMVMLVTFAHNLLLLLITSSLGAAIGAILAWIQVQLVGEAALPAISEKLGHNALALIYLVFGMAIAVEMVLRMLSMKSLALFDKLSTLRNRRYIDMHFDDVIEDAIESGMSLSLILIDADNFGNINKTYCQQSGDMVLQELGKAIKGAFWDSDLCARYGGEEFIVALRNTDLYGALKAAERLRRTVQSKKFPIFKAPYQIACTVSIGVATLRSGDTVKSIIARANEALLIAKQTGRNQVITEEEGTGGALTDEAEVVM